MKPRIILASGSPRRRQLLTQVGIAHEVIVSGADEDITGPPEEQVRELALRKAEAVRGVVCENMGMVVGDAAIAAARAAAGDNPAGELKTDDAAHSDAVIIAADTLVFIDGKVPGKPAGPEEAFDMLKTLQGRCHTVYTGVAVLRVGTAAETFVEAAQVYFRKLTDAEIWAYIATGEPFDKAGAYGVQEKGALLVERIVGDYFTVVGLPLARLAVTLAKMGIDVWQ